MDDTQKTKGRRRSKAGKQDQDQPDQEPPVDRKPPAVKQDHPARVCIKCKSTRFGKSNSTRYVFAAARVCVYRYATCEDCSQANCFRTVIEPSSPEFAEIIKRRAAAGDTQAQRYLHLAD